MEISGMDETKKTESILISAAAFVEGGIQEACDDACSICLEAFCESDPSTVTSCKHEFHLQCILEWCQRSSQCPMCWQQISLKDSTSQELLEAVERERSIRLTPPRNATIFHHPALGDFELQHLPVGANEAELEERIIQHLAAAAAMGRAHHIARREGQRVRSTAQGRPQFLLFSSHSNSPHTTTVSTSPAQRGEENESSASVSVASQSAPHAAMVPVSASGSSVLTTNQHGPSFNNRSTSPCSPVSQDRGGPSELQSFTESLKSRFNSVSMRYKESISKSTRGWKERLFSRSTSISDLGSEVRREIDTGFASVSQMIERLDTRENTTVTGASASNNLEIVTEADNQRVAETCSNNPLNDSNSSSCTASSGSS